MAAIRKDILRVIEDTKILSPSAAGLLDVASQEKHDLRDIVNVIKYDAALTAKTLKLVNSAAFALQSKVTNIERAISYIGENYLVSLAMNEAAGMIYDCDLAGYAGKEGELWEHNLLTALASKKVAEFSKEPVNANVAFTCGLLHDLGKAIISSFLEGSPPDVLRSLEEGEVDDYASAEEKILGIDHTQASHAFGEEWQLPEPIPSAIRFHHDPQKADEEYRSLVYAVHLGDMVAMMTGKGTGADAMRYQLDENYIEYIELNQDDLAMIILEIDNEFSKLQKSMTIDG